MHDAKDEHVLVFDAVHNHVFSHSQTAVTWAKIFLPGTTNIGEAGKREETVCDGVDEAVRNLVLPLSLATYHHPANQGGPRQARPGRKAKATEEPVR